MLLHSFQLIVARIALVFRVVTEEGRYCPKRINWIRLVGLFPASVCWKRRRELSAHVVHPINYHVEPPASPPTHYQIIIIIIIIVIIIITKIIIIIIILKKFMVLMEVRGVEPNFCSGHDLGRKLPPFPTHTVFFLDVSGYLALPQSVCNR